MGLKASATCELTFGQHGVPAVGHLLGEVHDGIAQMFEVIEYARMMVGTKAIGTLSAGYQTALAYAKERVQGPDLDPGGRQDRPARDDHPPRGRAPDAACCRRPTPRACARSTCTRPPSTTRPGGRAGRAARRRRQRPAAPDRQGRRQRAGVGDARALAAGPGRFGLPAGLPVEQYIRDAKIDSLYEGTTAIQALDLLFRKIVRDHGRALGHVVERDRGVPRRGGRERPAQGGARAARHRARGRPRHAEHARPGTSPPPTASRPGCTAPGQHASGC